MPCIGSCVEILGPQLVILFAKVVEHLGGLSPIGESGSLGGGRS